MPITVHPQYRASMPKMVYFMGVNSGAAQAITGSAIVMDISSEAENTWGHFSLATDEVEVKVDGGYDVMAHAATFDTNTAGGPRCTILIAIQNDIGAGFVTSVSDFFYHREFTSNNGEVYNHIDLVRGNKIRIVLQRLDGNTNVETISGSCFLRIVKVT